MIVKLLTEHNSEFLSLKGGCRGSCESTLIKMSNCWKSFYNVHFQIIIIIFNILNASQPFMFCFFLSSADFFPNLFFQQIHSGTQDIMHILLNASQIHGLVFWSQYPWCQTVLIQIRHFVCKGYQQMTNHRWHATS